MAESTIYPHVKYPSLENYKPKFKGKFNRLYGDIDIIVTEKIHGSNVCIVGTKTFKTLNSEWEIKLGSRNRWIDPEETFHNFHSVYEKYKDDIIKLFDELYCQINANADNGDNGDNASNGPITIRLFGEIFGGKYGDQKDDTAIRVQKEPNYCPFNDIAIFDIMVNNTKYPILQTHQLLQKYSLKTPPIIYRGSFDTFIEEFDINSFNSVLSKEFYNLDFIDTPKATEGVTIRTTNPSPRYKEQIILKYKKDWALECGKPKNNQNNGDNGDNGDSEFERTCYSMVNENRFNSYISKNTMEDVLDSELLGHHIKEIVADIIIDIKKEFPENPENPTLMKDIKKIKKNLSRRVYPMFKEYIKSL